MQRSLSAGLEHDSRSMENNLKSEEKDEKKNHVGAIISVHNSLPSHSTPFDVRNEMSSHRTKVRSDRSIVPQYNYAKSAVHKTDKGRELQLLPWPTIPNWWEPGLWYGSCRGSHRPRAAWAVHLALSTAALRGVHRPS